MLYFANPPIKKNPGYGHELIISRKIHIELNFILIKFIKVGLF